MRGPATLGTVVLLAMAAGCFRHADTPTPAKDAPCACRGHAPAKLDRARLCSSWSEATEGLSHAAFPELDPASCYVPVRYAAGVEGKPKPDPIPSHCGYPEPGTRAVLAREIARYDAIAAGVSSELPLNLARELPLNLARELPLDLACDLPPDERMRAARLNAATLRAAAEDGRKYPYAAVSTFGYGAPMHEKSGLMTWRPGDACPTLAPLHLARLGQNVQRAERAAAAFRAGVAPVITVSGGAIHSPVYETWILAYLLTCRLGVPASAILVDPCADHTHTNLRNTAGLVVALGGRSAYVVTTGIQVGYRQEWTTFDWIGGSIDQRSLRDFGYVVGSFRQASVGVDHGFWLTPYRFFAEPKDGLGGVTCVR
ncbi:MAG: YdcF family protein [Deltaproteobacteria bacterium]|nr:YdcF family protein [Deltaproteobacteria bacterium]